jgi:tetratricopeptide (TPR) repeat protein
MPPEQAAGQLDQLGPASDVYSLGATLYHVLAGRPPVTDKDIHSLLRKVQEGDFAPPRQVRNDVPIALQAICLKAMQTDPAARYASPQQLADDVERWLADEPVSAYREPLTVQVRRWMRKHHRIVSAIAATVLVGLTCCIVVAGVVSQKNKELATANGQLDQANKDLTTANGDLRVANDAERAAREEAEAVLDFFRVRVLAAARPQDQEGGLGIDATIRAAMDAAEPTIAESFAHQPLAEASIRRTVGTTYFYLGETNLAVAQHKRALDLRKSHLGAEHEKTLISMNELALAHKYAGDSEQAFQLYEQVLESTKVTLGENHPDTLTYTNNLGEAFRAAGRLDRALALLKDTFSRRNEVLGVDHPHTLVTMNNLAMAIEDAGNRDEAIPLFEEALQRRRKELGPEHPHTLQSMNNLAAAYLADGKPTEARELHESALELMKAKLGSEHPDTLRSMNNLARALGVEGEMDRCLALHMKTLELRRERLGPDHFETFQSLYNVANSYFVMEQPQKALSLIDEYIAERRSRLETDDPQLVEVLYQIGRLLFRYEQIVVAEKYLRDGLNTGEKHPPAGALLFAAKSMLGAALTRQSKFEEAQPLLIESYEGIKKLEGSRPIVARTLLSESLQRFVDLYTAWDKPDESARWQSKLDEHVEASK